MHRGTSSNVITITIQRLNIIQKITSLFHIAVKPKWLVCDSVALHTPWRRFKHKHVDQSPRPTVKNTHLIIQLLEQGSSPKDTVSVRLRSLGHAFVHCATTVHLITSNKTHKQSIVEMQKTRDEQLRQLPSALKQAKPSKAYHILPAVLKRFRALKVPSKYWSLCMFDDINTMRADEIRALIAWRESLSADNAEKCIDDSLILSGAYFVERGARAALLFLSWLGQRVLPVQINRKRDIDSDAGESLMLQYGQWPRLEFVSKKKQQQSRDKIQCLLGNKEEIEREVGHKFRDESLLLQMISHRSFTINDVTPANDLLAFLGEAVFSFLLEKFLYGHPQQLDAKRCTFIKSVLESNVNTANAIVRLEMQRFMQYSNERLREKIEEYVGQRRDRLFGVQIDVSRN